MYKDARLESLLEFFLSKCGEMMVPKRREPLTS
jgi:hypothetical protein